MDTHVRTPQEVFIMPQHLVVPPFQRAYVWSAEEQWVPFWQDVRRVAEARLLAEPAVHFFGAIVVQAQAPVPGEMTAHNIIDGQQRLTTLQLLMDAAEGVLAEIGLSDLAGQLENLTHNSQIYVTGGGRRLKLLHTNRDREAFTEVMDSEPPVSHADLTHSRSLIVRAHEYFHEAVIEWLGDTDSGSFAERAAALVGALTAGLQFVAINLGALENSQEIFETLNARGTPLTAADLIKNFVFQKLEAEGTDTKLAYAEHWPFDTKFWETEVSVGRYAISRSSLFLNQWLGSRLGEEVSPRSTFTRFKQYVERNGEKVTTLLPTIKAQASLYEQWTAAAENPHQQLSRVEMATYRMKASDFELLKPLLIWLHAPERGASPLVIDQVVAAAESWVIRRQLMRLTSSDLGRIVADMIRVFSATPGDELPERISQHLSQLNVASNYWPPDEEIRESLRTEPLYRRVKRGRMRMVLEAIEDHYRSETNQPQVPRSGYPIEHILPQNWAAHWPVPDLEAELERSAHVHRLGNLTLLTGSLNSKVSNGPWDDKREALLKHDTLLLNGRLLSDSAGTNWDEESIDARTDRLVDAILEIWPVPEGHTGQIVDSSSKNVDWIQPKDLVDAGLLEPGTTLRPRQEGFTQYIAVVAPTGHLVLDDKPFDSPSGAGRYLRGKATNGWHFWYLPDGRKLADVRAIFQGGSPATPKDLDWSSLHAILESLPDGTWTTSEDLAEVIGSAPSVLIQHLATCAHCAPFRRVTSHPGAGDHRVDGQPSESIIVTGMAQGFDSYTTDPDRRMAGDDLSRLIEV